MLKKNLKVLFLAIFILFITSCSKKAEVVTSATWTVDDTSSAIPVEVLNLTKGQLYRGINSAGVISGIQEAYIVSETKGIIQNINFDIGDNITTDQTLLKVDDTIAKLTMEQTKQQYESTKLELESIESFYKKGSASLQELTRARSSYNGANATYEASLKIYSDSSMTSPINGIITWKDNEATLGNYITPGMKIARVVDLSSLKIEVAVGERQIGLIELGAIAKISVNALSEDTINGTVTAISGGSDTSTGSFSVIVSAENSFEKQIRAGMSCAVIIEPTQSSSRYIVPTDSVVNRNGQDYLFTDVNGIATPNPIVKGEVLGNRTTIISGVNLDDKIIITGLNSIKPGVKVKSRTVGLSGDWL